MRKRLFVTLEYPPFLGGVARYIASLTTHLPLGSYDVLIPNTLPRKKVSHVHNANFFTKRIWPHWLPVLVTCIKFGKRKEIVSFVACQILPIGLAVKIASLITSKPYDVVVYGMDIAPKRLTWWKKMLVRWILRGADNIICISNFTASLVSSYTGHKKNNCFKICPTVHFSSNAVQKPPAEAIQDFCKNKKIFLSVGRLVRRKNNLMVLRVAKKLLPRDDIRFIIVGSGEEQEMIQQQIQQHALTNVCVLSDCSDEALQWLYANSTGLLLLSHEYTPGDVEGFGIVSIEAQSFGLPVIASCEGGVPETVHRGISGLIVDPQHTNDITSAVLSLTNETQWSSYSIEAKKFYAATYAPEIQKQSTLQVFGGMAPDIAVIIPAFNSEKTIRECLNSLMQQTLLPKEIILVDDGSTDTTAAIAKEFSQVKVISQRNSGAPAARNRGAQQATAGYLLFLDADITTSPHMLLTMRRELAKNPNASFAYSGFKFGFKKFPSLPFKQEKLKEHNYIHTSSLIRRSSFPGFDETLTRHQDWDLWLTIAKNGGYGIWIPKILYTIHPQKKRISTWIPSFVYTLPFANKLGPVRQYNDSAKIIKSKHNLS